MYDLKIRLLSARVEIKFELRLSLEIEFSNFANAASAKKCRVSDIFDHL